MALSKSAADALCLVELRGFEPLTPCMPLTSRPLTHHHTPTCSRTSAQLRRRAGSRSHSAACGVVRLSCWRIAGRSGPEGSTSSPRPPSGRAHGGIVKSCGWCHAACCSPPEPGSRRRAGSGPLQGWREELGECLGQRFGMGQGGGVPDAGDLVHPCVGDVVGHVPRAGGEEGLGVRSEQHRHRS